VYTYRRNRSFGKNFVDYLHRSFDSRIAYTSELPFPGDDVALAFSVVCNGYRFRNLPVECNLEMTSYSKSYDRRIVSRAEALHFHHSLSDPISAKWILDELKAELPEIAEWLASRVPVSRRYGFKLYSPLRRLLKMIRDARMRRHKNACRFYGPEAK
jgi:hypothetical protein